MFCPWADLWPFFISIIYLVELQYCNYLISGSFVWKFWEVWLTWSHRASKLEYWFLHFSHFLHWNTFLPTGKIHFAIYSLVLYFSNGSHTLQINSISKLPQKKILPLCFVGSSQCNSISHLSFNLLFIVAEHSETYYPEFPLVGLQQQQAPIKRGCLFFML